MGWCAGGGLVLLRQGHRAAPASTKPHLSLAWTSSQSKRRPHGCVASALCSIPRRLLFAWRPCEWLSSAASTHTRLRCTQACAVLQPRSSLRRASLRCECTEPSVARMDSCAGSSVARPHVRLHACRPLASLPAPAWQWLCLAIERHAAPAAAHASAKRQVGLAQTVPLTKTAGNPMVDRRFTLNPVLLAGSVPGQGQWACGRRESCRGDATAHLLSVILRAPV